MKKVCLLILLAGGLVACGQQDAKLDTTAQKAAYTLGYKSGEQLHASAPEIEVGAFVAGLRAGTEGKSKLSEEEMNKALEDFRKEMTAKHEADMKKSATDNLAKADAFLKENATKDGVKTLDGGIQYIVEKSGDDKGDMPTLNDTVVADYEGTLLDGTVFDSSIKRGQPATFPLAHVIEGWQKTLVHMHVGDKWKIFIPPALAYGEEGAGSVIGPNELLVFDVELKKVIKGDKKPAAKEEAGK
jgi:FKBP-type peptidyl-prolyl cis-trans isomerase